jgi:SAM-dependent methyltransferase
MGIVRSIAILKHRIKRAVGRASAPPVNGIADAAWYDAVYRQSRTYNKPYWYSHYYPVWTLIAERVRSAGAKTVLDIGCGPGQFANCLLALSGIHEYRGLDFSAETIAIARRVCPRGRFVVGDALTADLYDQSDTDITICTEVLEHLRDDLLVLSRFRGRCICTVPNFPYVSHVRHFSSAADVAARYDRFFEEFRVLPIRAPGSPTNMYFLLDGVRRPGPDNQIAT